MSEKILVPVLGESITEATVAKWLKKEGDTVEADEAIVELETDKVNLEVPSPIDGVLSEINAKDGETVEVGALLGLIDQNSSEKPKKQVITKNDKLKTLVSKRAVALAKKVESAVTLEQQIVVQQQLMSLISFVPDFNYAEQKMKDLASFYPSKDNVDNAFARWFVNDKNFIKLEDLQYPQRNTQWQR